MTALAQECGAINLAQGFPNFQIDPQLQQCLVAAANENAHQYAPMPGLVSLREQIALLVANQYKRTVDINEILVTAGATQAIFTTITSFSKTAMRSGEFLIQVTQGSKYTVSKVLLNP